MIFVLLTKLGLNAWKEEKDNITNSLFHWLLIVPDNYTLRNKQIWKFLINLAPSSFCTIKQKQTNWWLTEIHLSLLKNKRRKRRRLLNFRWGGKQWMQWRKVCTAPSATEGERWVRRRRLWIQVWLEADEGQVQNSDQEKRLKLNKGENQFLVKFKPEIKGQEILATVCFLNVSIAVRSRVT